MSKIRKAKRNTKDVSNIDISLDEPSTSSLSTQGTLSPSGTSPFRGFNGDVNQENLNVMNQVLLAKSGYNGSLEEASQNVSKIRKAKRNTKDVSNIDTSFDESSTSSQPTQGTLSPSGTSPFRGFNGDVNQENLNVMNQVLLAKSGYNGSLEEASQNVSSQKRKQACSAGNSKSKQVKTSKNLENGISKDFFKKPLAKDVCFSPTRKRPMKKQIHPSCTERSKSNEDFLGAESKGGNFVKIFDSLQRGVYKQSVFDEISERVTLKTLRWFKVFAQHEVTDLRITAMASHPSDSRIFVTGGKAGTMTVYEVDEENSTFCVHEGKMFPGTGPGGTMENIRFNPNNRNGLEVFTASVDGSISSYNFDGLIRKPLVQTANPTRVWFCGIDIHEDGKSVYGGDSAGYVAIHRLDSGKTQYGTQSHRLHKSKIRHVEFNPRDPNLMVTSSLDKTVKLWDIRKLNKNNYLECLEHTDVVSAAKFSRTDGCHLLTTDQYSELRVYKAPLWKLERTITHPHRHFQHLTVIRASWHPQADVFLIGRYPHDKFADKYDDNRSVDVFSVSSDKLHYELPSQLITSLVEFNSTGGCLASSSGRTLYLWKKESSQELKKWRH